MSPLKLKTTLQRKQAILPVYLVVPAASLKPWKLTATTIVDARVDGVSLGRRSLKPWDDERWFLELRQDHFRELDKSIGAPVTLEIELASKDLPSELQELLDGDTKARARWQKLTAAQQRMLREEIVAAKTAATRTRRARKHLLPVESPAPKPIRGVSGESVPVTVYIHGRRLPGASCGPYSEVCVGLVQVAGQCPAEHVAASARKADFTCTLELRFVQGAATFRGPAVCGRAPERFLYLNWLGRMHGAPAAMFRRAKLRLDCIPNAVLIQAVRSKVLRAELDLTAGDGMPACASIKPPGIVWTAR